MSAGVRGMNVRFLTLPVAVLVACLAGCARPAPADVQAEVRKTFDSFKDEIALGHAQTALGFLDRETLEYFKTAAARPPSPTEPATDLLVRRAFEKYTPGGIGPDFTLGPPLQRLFDKGILRPGDLDPLTLGPVTADPNGATAQGEAIWDGRSTTLQVTFRREDGVWKIDLLNLLPYAASALTMDRTIKRETQDEQVARLVGALPTP